MTRNRPAVFAAIGAAVAVGRVDLRAAIEAVGSSERFAWRGAGGLHRTRSSLELGWREPPV